ncbi:lysophospholipid acyltransferase family protein [Acinetobacter sp. ASP199]|uniref:lysophospholipid acyltransferase family protein n=1 Tax=unclassified Acinetobacter TaxID=196816 RepID=UPI001F60CD45|nr:lysophospholipid acyltransferase family protein [Acinetobacter sp. ASP199]UNT59747.1 lysophospholipid acyltransferase family protein [Acinetobacter sp. ASP199]
MYFLLTFLALLPLRILQSLGYLVAWLLYQTNSSIHRITQINIQLVYPELNPKQQKKIIRESIQSQCLSYLECIKFWGMPIDYALSRINKIHGIEHFNNAINEKKGIIVIVPHLGSWELLNAWLCTQTQPMIMYKPNRNKTINRYILEARQKTNAILVPADEIGIRAIFKHLKQGGLTVILPDHLPKPSGGIYADFFKQNVLSGTIVPKLAQKTQCNVVGVSCLRTKRAGHFDIHCSAVSKDIISKDIQTSVLCLNQHMEQMIAVVPAQYIWSYKRFRNCFGNRNPYKA